MTKVEINGIKVALADTISKNKRLAEQHGKDESTISQWCSNTRQPSLMNLHKIAVEIEIRELINLTKLSND